MNTTTYGLSQEQDVALHSELEMMRKRLLEIAVEIAVATPGKNNLTFQTACRAGDAVALLRYELEQEAEHRRMEEEIRRRLGKG